MAMVEVKTSDMQSETLYGVTIALHFFLWSAYACLRDTSPSIAYVSYLIRTLRIRVGVPF